MDKRTILAMFLTIVVVTLGMFVQTTLFSPEIIPEETNIQQQEYIADSNGNLQQFDAPTNQTLTSSNYDYAYIDEANAWNSGKPGSFVAVEDQSNKKEFLYNNGVLNITFDTKGASISSIKLTQHHDIDGNPVDLVFKGDSDKNAFLMYAGKDRTNPIDANFNYYVNGNEVVFSKTFALIDSDYNKVEPFTIIKTYKFAQNEYLFEVDVTIEIGRAHV